MEKNLVVRIAHQPTEETKKKVQLMAAVGINQQQIAIEIGICKETLEKHYRYELDTAATKANVKIATSLYTQAINGNVAAQIFWCKTRLGWREKSEVELSGKEGVPLTAILQIMPQKDK